MRSHTFRMLMIAWLFIGISCASRYGALENYKNTLTLNETKGLRKSSNRTVILFLIDGLPVSTLQSQFDQKRLKHIKNYFLGSKDKFSIARSAFPSITFPSIASLLTEQTIDQHGVYGNKIFSRGENYDFESPNDFSQLNAMVQGKNIFSRLTSKNQTSVSFSYTFNQDATAHIDGLDFKSGLAVQTQDYSYVDLKLIDSLGIFLEGTNPSMWPDFIYVHLVGVDLLSHQNGPKSNSVISHLQLLDQKLNKVFKILNKAEVRTRKKVVTLLTADHGFDRRIYKRIDLISILPPDLTKTSNVLNESRFASFHFPVMWTSEQKMQYAMKLRSNPILDIIAYRDGQKLELISRGLKTQIFYGPSICAESSFSISVGTDSVNKVCPEQIPFSQNQIFYPYFTTNIAHYFQTVDHPDIVIIPQPGVSFNFKEKGQHGGPTTEELFVPLLIHNGQISDSNSIIPLSDVLKFL